MIILCPNKCELTQNLLIVALDMGGHQGGIHKTITSMFNNSIWSWIFVLMYIRVICLRLKVVGVLIWAASYAVILVLNII